MKILITGAAGFIGFFLTKELIKTGHNVIGLDNLNEYYPVQLKLDRLSEKGIEISKIEYGSFLESLNFDNYKFIQADLTDKEFIDSLFRTESFDLIINLAAQAGVRYSIENPGVYVSSNIVGFSNILDASVNTSVKFLLYASSSSVYGNNDKIPFSEDDEVRSPASVYAATKLADELLAATYNHLYQLPSIGLRFFTVYGPWGRPDMAYFHFTKDILENRPIRIFNDGKLARDFTYIDDIINGIMKIVNKIEADEFDLSHDVLNIGRGKKINLLEFVEEIEKQLGKQAIKELVPMQKGDVYETYADITKLSEKFGYTPNIDLQTGITAFVDWYKKYYKVK